MQPERISSVFPFSSYTVFQGRSALRTELLHREGVNIVLGISKAFSAGERCARAMTKPVATSMPKLRQSFRLVQRGGIGTRA